LTGIKELIVNLASIKNDREFLDKIDPLIMAQELLLVRIEESLVEFKELLNGTRKNLLELSKSNVKIYVRNEENRHEHYVINERINTLLQRVKNNQRDLHNNNQCCSKCRFC
jgi:hypothetical protein